MGVSVVLKQYKGSAFDGIFRELKMFTYMENYKKISQPDQDIAEVAALGSQHDGLPQLLAYKIKNNIGEILMTNGGPSLDKWEERVTTKKARMSFMIIMLK